MKVNKENLTVKMERMFNAPVEKLWNIYKDPNLVPKWWGPEYLTTEVDVMEFVNGGKWRYIQKAPEGEEYAFRGIYKEIIPMKKITWTFEFEPMAGHIIEETVYFEEIDGKTKLITVSQYPDLDSLEGMIASGMEEGSIEGWNRLEKLL